MYRERPGRDNGRAVVPLPSLEQDAVYQEALKIVRKRRAKRARAKSRGEHGSAAPAVENPQLEAAGDGQVPKYLRLSCILKPGSAQAPIPPKRPRPRLRKEPQCLPLSWVELRDTLGLTVVAGLQPLLLKLASGEHRLPPGVWLVLDPTTAQRLPSASPEEDAGDLPLGTRPCNSKAFVAERSVPSLQLLDEEQLTWSAAEANFAKCARGACFLALKHAGFVLKALATKECIKAQQEGLEQERSLESTLEEIDAKVNRAAGLVGSRAAAETRGRRPRTQGEHSGERSGERSPKAKDSEVESSPRQASALRKGVQAHNTFVNFVCRKYGNCVRLWFVIDPEEHLKMGEKQFVRACEEIGFSGCLLTLWRQLDPDCTGHISFHDIDPAAASLLADFKVLLMEQFDGEVENFWKSVGMNRGQRAGRDVFVKALDDTRLQGARRLFELLCRHNSSSVSVRELRFLEKWSPPLYFLVASSRARPSHVRAVLQALADAAHGSALKGWFRVLDPEQTLRITFHRFKSQLTRFQQKPQEEDSLAQVWRAWDAECTGYLFLRKFHPESHEAAARLKRWAAKSGGVVKFMSQLEVATGRVTKATFRKALADVLEQPAADLLFDGLDVGDTGHLTEQEVRCLDRWDLAFEDELHGRLPEVT